MSQGRIGCYACFKTLDPKDKEVQLRSIFKCEKCGALYHAICSEGLTACYRCGQYRFRPVHIARPSATVGVIKQHAQTVKPSSIVEWEEKLSSIPNVSILGVMIYFVQCLWAIIFALMLTVIAAMLGSYGYRILQLPVLSVASVMNALFRTNPPATTVVISSLISGLIAGFVFYNRPVQFGRRFTYWCAGITTFVIFNLLLFDVNPTSPRLFTEDFTFHYIEILWAEGITALLVFLLIPIHRGFAHIKSLPPRKGSAWTNNLYGWIRLLIASYLLIVITLYLVRYWLSDEMNQLIVSTLYPRLFPALFYQINVQRAGVIAIALIVLSIGYWPPPFRQVKWRLGLLRLVITFVAVIAIGLLYHISSDPQALLMTLGLSGILMIVMLPIQRIIS